MGWRNLTDSYNLSLGHDRRCCKAFQREMEDLREFYDPDTVDLMQWLQQHTAPRAAVSGSMQLMAGVKLCAGRPVTNHPHFEDAALREKTRQLYQVYAKTGPAEVHAILVRYNASFIVLEDSICLAHRERCSLPDILDLSNGHVGAAAARLAV